MNLVPAAAGENVPVETAATAKLKVTSAVASFTRLSPSRMVTSLRGRRMRRSSAIGATASGGETIAPSTKPTAQERPSTKWEMAATAAAVTRTQPIASSRMGRRLARNPRQLMPTPE